MRKKPAHTSPNAAKNTATSTPRQGVTGDGFFGWDGDTLVVNVLGKPSAGKDAIGTPLGKELRISVTAAPENGKATDHMVRFLAPLFGVRASQIEVVFGRESVHKQLRIHAPKKMPAVFGQALSADRGADAP